MIINAEVTTTQNGKKKVTFITAPNTFLGRTLQWFSECSGSKRKILAAFTEASSSDLHSFSEQVKTGALHFFIEASSSDLHSFSEQVKTRALHFFIEQGKTRASTWNQKKEFLKTAIDSTSIQYKGTEHDNNPRRINAPDRHYKNYIASLSESYQESAKGAEIFPLIIKALESFFPVQAQATQLEADTTTPNDKTISKIEKAEEAWMHIMECYNNLIEESRLIMPADTTGLIQQRDEVQHKMQAWCDSMHSLYPEYQAAVPAEAVILGPPVKFESAASETDTVPSVTARAINNPKPELEILRVLAPYPENHIPDVSQAEEAKPLQDENLSLLPGFGPHPSNRQAVRRAIKNPDAHLDPRSEAT